MHELENKPANSLSKEEIRELEILEMDIELMHDAMF